MHLNESDSKENLKLFLQQLNDSKIKEWTSESLEQNSPNQLSVEKIKLFNTLIDSDKIIVGLYLLEIVN